MRCLGRLNLRDGKSQLACPHATFGLWEQMELNNIWKSRGAGRQRCKGRCVEDATAYTCTLESIGRLGNGTSSNESSGEWPA
jgi:hypothetical protein